MPPPLDVVFDHEDFVVINKPCNFSVQNEVEHPGLLPLVCQKLNIDKLWLVHRLDKITSGLWILAKNEAAAGTFGKLFENRLMEKFYVAIAAKKPKKKQGTVSGGMKKARDGQWMLDHSTANLATTQFYSFSLASHRRLFLLKPLTGKTHQIRVMMKSLGSPILGDKLYKGEDADRAYLHAYALRFQYQDQAITLTLPPSVGENFIDNDCQQQLRDLGAPWLLQWPKVKS
ncbi:MAG: TIGR01621 family pseudouridine synthase [Paraglaciecola sp.]|nr:TIGR01621 family pseudouridine synthase [Paraglaciecola sp.]NCT49092.1 TIGR01621 family pseudouridine synthase [Paraglaciecola sp.]